MSVPALRAVHHVPGPTHWLRRQVLRSYARMIEWTTLIPGGGINVSQVAEWLWVGGAVARARYPDLASIGINSVIDLRAERRDDEEALKRLGIDLLHLPSPDHFAPSPENLLEGALWARPRLQAGKKFYVHCAHGVGRGPLMALCLMVSNGGDPIDSYRVLREQRWQALLNDRQLAALAGFCELWAQRTGAVPRTA